MQPARPYPSLFDGLGQYRESGSLLVAYVREYALGDPRKAVKQVQDPKSQWTGPGLPRLGCLGPERHRSVPQVRPFQGRCLALPCPGGCHQPEVSLVALGGSLVPALDIVDDTPHFVHRPEPLFLGLDLDEREAVYQVTVQAVLAAAELHPFPDCDTVRLARCSLEVVVLAQGLGKEPLRHSRKWL